MNHKWLRMVIFLFLSFSQILPVLSQDTSGVENWEDKKQLSFNLFKIMEKGSEKEKQLAWQKFVENLPPPFSFIDGSYLEILKDIINEIPEPYKKMAWKETALRLSIDSTYDSIFLVNLILTAPEPYKGSAWFMLTNWQFLTHGQVFHNYYRIVMEGLEPYKIWAWQQLQTILQKMKDEERINLADMDYYWTDIIQQAPEPYKLWAWQKLLSDKSSPYFFGYLIDVMAKDRNGQYSELAWIEMAQQENEFWEENLYFLKRITQINNLHYQKLAVSKLLTLKSLSLQDRETAKEMYRVFYSEESEDNYSINWVGFITYQKTETTYHQEAKEP